MRESMGVGGGGRGETMRRITRVGQGKVDERKKGESGVVVNVKRKNKTNASFPQQLQQQSKSKYTRSTLP